MPFWQSLPPATTTLMSEALVSLYLARVFVCVSSSLSPRYTFSVCFLFSVLIVGVASFHVLNHGNREAVPFVHFTYFLRCLFSLHTSLSFERESSETIL